VGGSLLRSAVSSLCFNCQLVGLLVVKCVVWEGSGGSSLRSAVSSLCCNCQLVGLLVVKCVVWEGSGGSSLQYPAACHS
jgi:hypothetical protein